MSIRKLSLKNRKVCVPQILNCIFLNIFENLSLLNKGCDKSKNVVQKVALDVFFNHFKELNNVVNEVDVELPDNIPEYNYVINSDISEREVNDAIRSLKNNKACGNDSILNEFLKNASGKQTYACFCKDF